MTLTEYLSSPESERDVARAIQERPSADLGHRFTYDRRGAWESISTWTPAMDPREMDTVSATALPRAIVRLMLAAHRVATLEIS